VETREDKLKGRTQLRGKIIESSADNLLTEDELMRKKKQEYEKDLEIKRLEELCDKFNINRFKNKIKEKLTKVMDELELESAEYRDKEGQLMEFMDKLIEGHKKELSKDNNDVFLKSLENYKDHLQELE
jgi:hypothetical protein